MRFSYELFVNLKNSDQYFYLSNASKLVIFLKYQNINMPLIEE